MGLSLALANFSSVCKVVINWTGKQQSGFCKNVLETKDAIKNSIYHHKSTIMKQDLFRMLFSLILLFGFLPAFSQTNTGNNQDKKDSIVENITYLNAANFNFDDNADASYLGKLNIFAPNIGKTPFGFNAGIMRVKFNYNDTSHSRYYIENRKIHPLDSIKQGNKYLREYNKYTTTRSNTIWSFYVQPMYRLVTWAKSAKTDNGLPNSLPNAIYLHLHAELLVNKTNVTSTIENLQRDTSLVDTIKPGIAYFYSPTKSIIDDRTFLNGYFGLGLNFNLDPFGNGNSRFFFQPTIGITTNYPNWASQDISSTTVSLVPVRGSNTIVTPVYQPLKSKWFYLVRTEFIQNISDDAQLIIGSDIRGLFPKFNPVYATYVGVNVNVNAIANIFSKKNNTAVNEHTTTTSPNNSNASAPTQN
jgi:hypothetical protein